MGREVRRVPATWEHPKGDDGEHIPLHDGFNERAATWDRQAALWAKGLREPFSEREALEPVPHGKDCTFEEWDGERPVAEDYMPDWPAEERTHYQMYETCSEGTPISPVMDSPETLARWLADNGASAFGDSTASYEAWLDIARGDWAPTMVIGATPGRPLSFESGVEFMHRTGTAKDRA